MTQQPRFAPKPPPRPSSPSVLMAAVSQTLTNLRASPPFSQPLSQTLSQALSSLSQRLPPPLTPRRLCVVAAVLLLLPVLLSSPPLPETPLEALRHALSLSAQPSNTRAHALAAALRAWRSGGPPPAVVAAAAACSERDAEDAALRALATFPGALRRYAVIDVGAGAGAPLAKLALAKGLRWLLAVEPDDAAYARLAALRKRGVKFVPVKGALSDVAGDREMGFGKAPEGEGGGCFDCGGDDETGVKVGWRKEKVSTHLLDELVLQGKLGVFDDAKIGMLSVGVGGHEGKVLAGGKGLLATGRVAYARVKVDVRASRDDTLTCVRELLGAGLKCVGLRFDGVREEEKTVERFPMFGQQVTWRTAEVFYRFVNATGRSTDLFCAKRAG